MNILTSLKSNPVNKKQSAPGHFEMRAQPNHYATTRRQPSTGFRAFASTTVPATFDTPIPVRKPSKSRRSPRRSPDLPSRQSKNRSIPTCEAEIVYGKTEWGLVFLEKSRAIEFLQLRDALKAKTWGEFKHIGGRRLATEVWDLMMKNGASDFGRYYSAQAGGESGLEQLVTAFKSLPVGRRLPEDDDAFSPEVIPGFGDGYWPEWAAGKLLEWIPDSIRSRFGVLKSSGSNGSHLTLDPMHESEIVEAIERLGYRCELNEALVLIACGCI